MASTTLCLPFDDWSAHLVLPDDVEVRVWRPGTPAVDLDAVTLYVPDYMGDAESFRLIASLPNLEVVQTLTAGVDDVLPFVPPSVTLCNARGVHDASTAELTLALILASLRGLPDFIRAQDDGIWRPVTRPALADRRVVIIGAGAVARAIAARLLPFETTIQLVGRTSRPGVSAISDVEALLPNADVVIVAVPLTEGTRHLVDDSFLASMRDGALLVNVARGQVVDTSALLRHLKQERLAAALDVTDPEPLPPNHPLWRMPNVLISPHVGGNSSAFLPRAWRLLREQIARYLAGEPLVNVVQSGSGRLT